MGRTKASAPGGKDRAAASKASEEYAQTLPEPLTAKQRQSFHTSYINVLRRKGTTEEALAAAIKNLDDVDKTPYELAVKKETEKLGREMTEEESAGFADAFAEKEKAYKAKLKAKKANKLEATLQRSADKKAAQTEEDAAVVVETATEE
jgi:hypothetical protein